jgi:hypothetical protein
MKILTVAIALAGTTVLSTVAAVAGFTDPLVLIYRVTGVLDSGDVANTGTATVFFCTNFGNGRQTVRISLRLENPGAPINTSFSLDPGETKTFATHATIVYSENGALAPGQAFEQGSAIIYATSLNVHCSAAQVDASTAGPVGSPLHMVRFNPANNSQEGSLGKRSTVPAIKAADDPLQVIYRVSGVLDNGGGGGVGTATVFFCTNFSGVEERVRISLRRRESGGAPVNNTGNYDPGETRTFATHSGVFYNLDQQLANGVIFQQGSAVIYATSVNVHCSAAQVDASAAAPVSIALHMVRLNPVNNSQE